MRRFLEALLFSILLVGGLVALHRGAALDGELLLPLDVLGSYEPWRSEFESVRPTNPALTDQIVLHPWTPLAAERLVHQRKMTLWNPYQGSGSPLHANTLSAQLYPLMWLHALLPRHAALLAIGMLKGFLAGFFLFLFLRRRGASVVASTMAGLALPLSGFFTVWLGHQHTAVASLLPLLLWLVDRAVDRATLVNLACVGLVSGATLLAGHAETAVHVLLLSIAYGSFRCFVAPLSVGRRFVRLCQLAGGFLLGALVSMIQVLPFAEYSLLYSTAFQIRHHPLYRFHNAWRDLQPGEFYPAIGSIGIGLIAIVLAGRAVAAFRRDGLRPAIPRALLATVASVTCFAIAFRLGLIDLLELLFAPDRHGSPLLGRANGSYGGYLLYVEMNCGFASVAATLLAIVGLSLRKPRDLGAIFWGGVLFVGLGVVFEWPVIAQLVSKTPIFAEAKNKRVLLFTSLAILILAVKGIDALIDASRKRDRRTIFAPLLPLFVLFTGVIGGRLVSPPVQLAGRPAVGKSTAPEEVVATQIASGQLPSNGYFGTIRGGDRERLYDGDTLTIDGFLYAESLPTEVRFLLAGPEGERSLTLELAKQLPADVMDAATSLPATYHAGAFHAELDTSTLPSGPYRLFTHLLRDGNQVGQLLPHGVYLSRPDASPWPLLYAFATLACLLLFAFAPALRYGIAVALLLLVLIDLFRFADGFNPSVDPRWDFPETPALAWLREHQSDEFPTRIFGEPPVTQLPANIATHYRLRDIRMYDSVDIRHYTNFLLPLVLSGDEGATRARLDAKSRMFDLLAARYQLATNDSVAPADHFRDVHVGTGGAGGAAGSIVVRENLHALPRAFVAPAAVNGSALLRALGQDPTEPGANLFVGYALKRLADQGRIDLGQTIVVRDLDEVDGASDALPDVDPDRTVVPARFRVDDPDRIVMETNAQYPGFLFLADVWMPGWNCRVDGVETPVTLANIAFRAVPIDAGEHEVEFYYAPDSVTYGGWLSLAGLGLIVLCLISGLVRRVASTSRPSGPPTIPPSDG